MGAVTGWLLFGGGILFSAMLLYFSGESPSLEARLEDGLKKAGLYEEEVTSALFLTGESLSSHWRVHIDKQPPETIHHMLQNNAYGV